MRRRQNSVEKLCDRFPVFLEEYGDLSQGGEDRVERRSRTRGTKGWRREDSRFDWGRDLAIVLLESKGPGGDCLAR